MTKILGSVLHRVPKQNLEISGNLHNHRFKYLIDYFLGIFVYLYLFLYSKSPHTKGLRELFNYSHCTSRVLTDK